MRALKPRRFLPLRPLVWSVAVFALLAAVVASACGGNENSNDSFAQATPAATRPSDGLPGTEIPSNGNEVVTPGQKHGNYYSNPPTSGWHYSEVPSPGIYTTALTAEDVPAFLEAGGVWVLYNCPGGCEDLVNKLVPIVNGATEKGKPVALAPYTLMDRKIALVAWQRLQTLTDFDEGKTQTFIDKLSCRYNPAAAKLCPTAAGQKTAAKDAGSGGFTGQKPTPSPTATPSTTKRYPAAPAMQIDPNKTYIATIKMAKGGEIKVQLDPKAAPQTVNNFVFLARDGFYDGVTFHRVIPGFVAQGGDPTGTGSGGPGYSIPDEAKGNPLKHEEGVIAMANAGPNTAGSQFYITLAPQPSLDNGAYTVFGKVISGMDVVKGITARDPSRGANLPPGDKIETITIEER